MTTTGWQTLPSEFPWPPPNVQVLSPLHVGALDLRWDDPSLLNTGPTTNIVAAAATITVTGTPAVLATASGTITVTSVPLPAGTTITVDTVTLTAVAGARTPGDDDFSGSLGTPALVAADIAAAINDGSLAGFGVATATASGAVVTVVAATEGAAGNDVALATSSPSVLLSGSSLSGGADADTLTIGSTTLTAVTGSRSSGGQDFAVGPTSFDTATSISAAINDPNNLVSFVTSVAGGNEVNVTASVPGSDGNAIMIATTSSALSLSGTSLADGEGNAAYCQGKSNSRWSIVGVNVYRSDNGERGPYVRINKFPIGSLCCRDFTDNVLVEDEVVQWDGSWVSKGDSPNDKRWAFRTYFCPIVKPNVTPARGNANHMVATHANAPSDVVLKIDGVVVPVDDVFGPNGEVTLINQPAWDLARQRTIPPVLPAADGSSEVTVTYWYNRNLVRTDLDRTTQVFYRLTTVALDPSSPSGYVETPLAYSPPVSVSQVESPDYIWREGVRRNNWILQQGGERVKLFKRKVSGIVCPCRIDERTFEYLRQVSNTCVTCFGTGFVGGYDGPIDIIVAPDDADRRVSQTPNGLHLEHTYEVWTGPSPVVTQRDFIVKQTNERYAIGPVRRPSSRGLALQQHFNIGYLDEQDVRYRIPLDGIRDLPWPQTRNTDPNSPCDPSPPYPVGFDYQATPMETEKGNIPDEREQRGRTPVWANTTY
jgi:hypothetical protein